MPTLRMGDNDTPLIDHLVMRADRLATAPYTREFVTLCPVVGRICEQFADVEQSSLRNDIFFGSSVPFKLRVFEEHTPFVEIKPHMHMLRVYGHRR